MFKNIVRKIILFVIVFSLSILVIPFNNIYANTSTLVRTNACFTFYSDSTPNNTYSYVDHDIYMNGVTVDNGTYILGYSLTSSFNKYNSSYSDCSNSTIGDSTKSIKLFNETIYYNWGGVYPNSTLSSFVSSMDLYTNSNTMSVQDLVSYIVPNDNQNVFSYEYATYLPANTSINSWTGPSSPYTITANEDIYIVGLNISDVYFVSESPFQLDLFRDSHNYYSGSAIEYLGKTYYLYKYTNWNYSSSYTYGFNWFYQSTSNKYLALYTIPHSSGGNVNQFGDLVDVGYYTKFVNNQQSSTNQLALNKDVITWNKYVDSVGNDITISDYNVEIQAQVIEYEANSSSALLNLVINDLALIGNPITIGDVSASSGTFEITWQEVANAINNGNILTNILSKLMPYTYENLWYKNGWYYRIRLYNEEVEYYSDWQIIYQLTSYDVNDSNEVINYYIVNDNSVPNQTINNIINNINTTNNTNNYWYDNEVPIGNGGSNSTWIEQLIESITYLIGKLIDAIVGIGGEIISGIFDIISDSISSILDFFTNLWNSFVNLFNGFNFTDENSDYDIDITDINSDLPEGETLYDIIPAFIRMINNSGLGFFIWLPLIVGIIYIVL